MFACRNGVLRIFITPYQSTNYSVEDQEVLLNVKSNIRVLLSAMADPHVNGKEDWLHKSPSLDSVLGEMNLVFPLCPCFPSLKSFLTNLPTVQDWGCNTLVLFHILSTEGTNRTNFRSVVVFVYITGSMERIQIALHVNFVTSISALSAYPVFDSRMRHSVDYYICLLVHTFASWSRTVTVHVWIMLVLIQFTS
jgi:hypothetical protein